MKPASERIRDLFQTLEQLWLAALVTAIASVTFNVARGIWYWPVSTDYDPAIGFAFFGVVSGIGFFLGRADRRQRLENTATAARTLLDHELAGWRPGETVRYVSLRTLAVAARADDLQVEIAPAIGNNVLGAYVADLVRAFSTATAHDAGTLWPPRANARVRSVIQRVAPLSAAAEVYRDKALQLLTSELRYDLVKRHAQLRPYARAVAAKLAPLVSDAEDLERLFDPKGLEARRRAYDEEVALRTKTRMQLQALAATAARSLLTAGAPAGDDLAASSIARAEATLRDLADDPSFKFLADAEAAAVRWLARIRAAGDAAKGPFVGKGEEMHPWTWSLWEAITNAGLLPLEREVQALQGALHAQGFDTTDSMRPRIDENIVQSWADVHEVLVRLVRLVDQVVALQISR